MTPPLHHPDFTVGGGEIRGETGYYRSARDGSTFRNGRRRSQQAVERYGDEQRVDF